MKFIWLLFWGTTVWGRGPTVQCQSFFFLPERIHFSQAEIKKMFYDEYGKYSTNPVLLQHQDVQLFSRKSPLYVLSAFDFSTDVKQEITSSELYANNVLKRTNEKLLFLSSYEHISVPGFDGIIYSQRGKPVANYSLKTTLGEWLSPLRAAVNRAVQYSENEMSWFSNLVGRDFENSDEITFRFDKWPAYYESQFKSVVYLTKLLGVPVKCFDCPVRKTRIVIHLKRQKVQLSEMEMEFVQQQIQRVDAYIESVSFVGYEGTLVIDPDKTQFFKR